MLHFRKESLRFSHSRNLPVLSGKAPVTEVSRKLLYTDPNGVAGLGMYEVTYSDGSKAKVIDKAYEVKTYGPLSREDKKVMRLNGYATGGYTGA